MQFVIRYVIAWIYSHMLIHSMIDEYLDWLVILPVGLSWLMLPCTFFFSFIFISWKLITLQYCSGFCHTLTWISHGFMAYLHVFPIAIPPPTSLPIPSLWVFPVHQPWALVSYIQPGLMICFTLDSVLVSMLFFQNIPPSPSPTESKSLFCTYVSLFLFCHMTQQSHFWA